MKRELTYDEALHRAAAYCTASEKSAFDVREKLTAWGIAPDDNRKIVAYLTKEKFIDEARFVRAFVNDKFRFNKWGKAKISFALKAKNIAGDLVREALDSIGEADYADTLTDLLRAKAKGLKYKDDYDRRAKLFRFALSRGFDSREIQKRLGEM
jgi:regulatory protein